MSSFQKHDKQSGEETDEGGNAKGHSPPQFTLDVVDAIVGYLVVLLHYFLQGVQPGQPLGTSGESLTITDPPELLVKGVQFRVQFE